MKSVFIQILYVMITVAAGAQKQSFDVITYSAPRGWQQVQNEGGVQLSVTDKASGAYAIAIITKATASGATAAVNFRQDWVRLVKSSVKVQAEPEMNEPAMENGWSVLSGHAAYLDKQQQGQATLLTATGGGRMVSVVLLTNTDRYQNELLAFLQSMSLSGMEETAPAGELTGIWGQYQSESYMGAGGSSNLTAGYDWREYYFNANGTYQFLQKSISYLYQNEIVFAYERGTYRRNGNQLRIEPQSGMVESWSKAGSDKAGRLLKTEKRTLEAVTYTINFHYFAGIQKTNLVLQYEKQTIRDGAFSTNGLFKNAWLYSRPFDPGKPQIELPAGSGIKLTTKDQPVSVNSQPENTVTAAAPAELAGKIWEGRSAEKYTGGNKGYHTGGFFAYQYRFYADGRYRYIYVGASAYSVPNLLQYESGTYLINGNKLTITPQTGANEEWSVRGGPVKIPAMNDVQVRAIRENWGRRMKSSKRVLEKITYTFHTEFMAGNNANALVLEGYNGNTVREGRGERSVYFETMAANSVPLPAGFNE